MLLEQIRDAGIVGAGGAGFPTHVKLDAQADYILMNAAECEPLLRVDQQIMIKESDEILKGFVAAGQQIQAKEAIIGVKSKHKKMIAHLHERIKAMGMDSYVRIHEMRDAYPAGDEQVLVYELTGRVVPEAGIPLNVGCVVVNSETLLNVAHAMQGEAVTKTYVTLAGDIPRRLTFKVPIGMSLLEILKYSGVEDFSDYAVIAGGPMMGPVLTSLDVPVTKIDKGFIILKKDHPLIRKKTIDFQQANRINRGACEQCRMCTDLCPRFLIGHNMQPHKMMTATSFAFEGIDLNQIALLCCECGLCDLFSCPANLYPKEANLILKAKLAEQNIRYTPKKTIFEPHSQRAYRLVPSSRLIARLQLTDYDADAPLEDVDFWPEEVVIKTKQHIGAPVMVSVSVGDEVVEGQCIGRPPTDSLGACIHASISGQVTDITADAITIRRIAHV